MIERWKPILTWTYAVSNRGRVKRTAFGKRTYPGKIVKPWKDGKYDLVNLTYHGKHIGFYVHELVAREFIGPRPPGKEVNHKDLNKRNNWDWNLEYVTPKRNIQHARDAGALHFRITKWHARMIREFWRRGYTSSVLANRFGISEKRVQKLVHGRRWAE